MNAIVGLCHFCEAHGPRPLFCTFTTDDERLATESSKFLVQCNGCTSLGPETVLMSKDDDGTKFCSRECVPNSEINTFLRQAAVRSITCEVSWSKDGGVVYFSDTWGHVLSLMFQLKDTRARGLKRWFSIVVLMKDKMLLLNITPLMSEHMKKVSMELQKQAEAVYDTEQSICSQRSLRLKTGRNDFGQSRSLIQLTGDDNVYKRLHTHFTWMLKAGALNYTETLYTSQDLLTKLNPQSLKGSIFESHAGINSDDECIPLRALENLLTRTVFRILLYCVLTGIEIQICTNNTDPATIFKGLLRLQPIKKEDPYITIIKKEEIYHSKTACILEEKENGDFSCSWYTLPAKCPTLFNKIESAICNTKFNDSVLHQHVNSLLLHWLGTAKAIKSAIESSGAKSEAVTKLKQVLDVTQYDDCIIEYWMRAYC